MQMLWNVVITGVGATALVDAWGLARERVAGIRAPDYGLLGRWIGHFARGRFRHDAIAASAPVRGERVLGWTAHYATGVAFAALVPLAFGPGWFAQPTPGPALAVGLATVAAPFLLLQPGMGAGLAARRTPRPWAARLQSVVTHAVFGLGLHVSALVGAASGLA